MDRQKMSADRKAVADAQAKERRETTSDHESGPGGAILASLGPLPGMPDNQDVDLHTNDRHHTTMVTS
jgi:hypothetical protein